MSVSYRDMDYFSPGFRNLMVALAPYRGRLDVGFPRDIDLRRITGRESVHDWFRDVMDNAPEGAIDACSIETNMAVFAKIRYRYQPRREPEIQYVNVQVVIAEADLTSFYCDGSVPCSYFRLDYDLTCLGEMFKEPLPHIHTVPEGPPRISMGLYNSGNIVVDFFELIYLNFFHEKWLHWARTAFEQGHGQGGAEIFDPIQRAYRANQPVLLSTSYGKALARIKIACRDKKDHIFPARVNLELATLLTYDISPDPRSLRL